MRHWLKRTWWPLLAANVVSMAVQGLLLAGLLGCGLAPVPSVAVAKGTSWLCFFGQLALCRK
jgi:hypothetical protein